MSTPVPDLRSPADKVGGIVYFGRMVDKIRLKLAGKLPEDYHANLGGGFDERCVHFLKISYPALVDRVTANGGSDDELLQWAFTAGQQPDEEQIEIWNGFMTKRGWKDEVSPTLSKRKESGGFTDRTDIETFFQFIDADEGKAEE